MRWAQGQHPHVASWRWGFSLGVRVEWREGVAFFVAVDDAVVGHDPISGQSTLLNASRFAAGIGADGNVSP